MTEEEKTPKNKITVYGIPHTTDGLLKPHDIKIERDGEMVPRLAEFEFKVKVGGMPMVKMVSYSPHIELDLEGVEINHKIVELRIFDLLENTLKDMDYQFRLAWRNGRNDSWKRMTVDDLKEGLDTVFDHLGTVIEQWKNEEREMIDIQMFAIKVANYGMLLADRVDRILKEKEEP